MVNRLPTSISRMNPGGAPLPTCSRATARQIAANVAQLLELLKRPQY